MDWFALASVGTFLSMLVGLVLLRARTANRFEVKNTDVILAIIPIALVLLVTGKIKSFQFGDLRVEAALKEASESAITPQVAPVKGLPIRDIEISPKGGIEVIPLLIAGRVEALEFRLGHGGYYGPAISEYFRRLAESPAWRYVILDNPDGSLYAMTDGKELAAQLRSESPQFTVEQFAEWLNRADRDALSRLPSFISVDHSVSEETDKGEALQRMESLGTDILPVTDRNRRFVGLVERSRLTASLIIDVTQQLKGK